MRVLRDNRDSVMAMLEAFVYDPLISWRLLREDNSKGDASKSRENSMDGLLYRSEIKFYIEI
jgi:FKBP12-rapamycin complex-associated protein